MGEVFTGLWAAGSLRALVQVTDLIATVDQVWHLPTSTKSHRMHPG